MVRREPRIVVVVVVVVVDVAVVPCVHMCVCVAKLHRRVSVRLKYDQWQPLPRRARQRRGNSPFTTVERERKHATTQRQKKEGEVSLINVVVLLLQEFRCVSHQASLSSPSGKKKKEVKLQGEEELCTKCHFPLPLALSIHFHHMLLLQTTATATAATTTTTTTTTTLSYGSNLIVPPAFSVL